MPDVGANTQLYIAVRPPKSGRETEEDREAVDARAFTLGRKEREREIERERACAASIDFD